METVQTLCYSVKDSVDKILTNVKKLYSESRLSLKLLLLGSTFMLGHNLYYRIKRKANKYPPGPIGLPFVGCFFQYLMGPRKFVVYIANKYGPITYVPFMASQNIFISDHRILKQLYHNEKILDRPPIATRPVPLFAQINGEKWDRRRKFAMKTILNLKTSFVLSNIKQCIQQYIEPIINEKYLSNKNNNKLWYPQEYIHFITFNNICASVFGVGILPFNDTFVNKYCKFALEALDRTGIAILIDLMTNFSQKVPTFIKWNLTYKLEQYGDEILLEWMNKNGFIVDQKLNILKKVSLSQKNAHADDSSVVYIDYLIEKLNNNEITIGEIISDVHLLLQDAIDSSSKSTVYGLLLLAKFANVQETVYKELTNVLKEHNLNEFSFEILNKLHFFRAFVYEVLRISSMVPSGAPHMTTKEHIVEINEKQIVIPKNTITHSNTYYMHKYLDWSNDNKPLKKENNVIHLEYWLDCSTKTFKMNENFILFGVGKRDCVGRSLGLRAMHSIYALLLRKYKFVAPNNDPDSINIKTDWGFIMNLHPSGIQVEKRSIVC